MFSENNRHTAVRRANDDFLRRMIGGEMDGDRRPGTCQGTCERSDFRPHSGCDSPRSACNEGRSVTPRLDQEQTPPCNEGDHGSCQLCPTHVHAPSLAMVYSPMQCWRNLLDPTSALSEGTLFAELVLPLEVGRDSKTKEVCNRRCNL